MRFKEYSLDVTKVVTKILFYFLNDWDMADEKTGTRPGEMKPEHDKPVVGNPVEKKDTK